MCEWSARQIFHMECKAYFLWKEKKTFIDCLRWLLNMNWYRQSWPLSCGIKMPHPLLIDFFRSQLIWSYTVYKDKVNQGSAGPGLKSTTAPESLYQRSWTGPVLLSCIMWLYPTQTLFVEWGGGGVSILFSRCPSALHVSIRDAGFPTVLKTQWWIYINFC